MRFILDIVPSRAQAQKRSLPAHRAKAEKGDERRWFLAGAPQ
jgi:hypothetical protein